MLTHTQEKPTNGQCSPKPGLRQKIPSFLRRIELQDQHYETNFCRLEDQFNKEAAKQIKAYFSKAREDFRKNRKKLDKELVTLRYYAEHPEENHNLYPLLVQIDEKFIYNMSLIQESKLSLGLPCPTGEHLDQETLLRKINVYESCMKQMGGIINSEAIRKLCKKEAQAGLKVLSSMKTLLANVKQTVYSPEVKLKRPFEELLTELPRYKHVEKCSLSLVCSSGVVAPSGYHQLLQSLGQNRQFLSELRLRLMDMEFTQEKADILRKRLNQQFKHLKVVSIHNYYKECKLGMFEDFNWAPFRKEVHITAGVW